MKGNILVINTGSTTTKLGYYSDGERVFDEKLEHTADEVAKYYNREVDDFCDKAIVPGFRVGKAPRKVIEKKFKNQFHSVSPVVLFQILIQIPSKTLPSIKNTPRMKDASATSNVDV